MGVRLICSNRAAMCRWRCWRRISRRGIEAAIFPESHESDPAAEDEELEDVEIAFASKALARLCPFRIKASAASRFAAQNSRKSLIVCSTSLSWTGAAMPSWRRSRCKRRVSLMRRWFSLVWKWRENWASFWVFEILELRPGKFNGCYKNILWSRLIDPDLFE